jgi:hypothetical protein
MCSFQVMHSIPVHYRSFLLSYTSLNTTWQCVPLHHVHCYCVIKKKSMVQDNDAFGDQGLQLSTCVRRCPVTIC